MPVVVLAGACSSCALAALGNLAVIGRLQVYLPIRSASAAIPATLAAVLLVGIYVGALLVYRGLAARSHPPQLFYFLFGAMLWIVAVMPVTQVLLVHYGRVASAAMAAGWAAVAAFAGVRLFNSWCAKRGLA